MVAGLEWSTGGSTGSLLGLPERRLSIRAERDGLAMTLSLGRHRQG